MKRCKLCGAEIEDRTSHNTKYCSSKCAREAEARQNINADELRAFTVPFDITPEERATAKAECADAIADLIFTDG